MKIKRSLKYGSFSWNDETKLFTVEYKDKSIVLNKTYAFSFLRFAFSVAQRNWFRAKPKTVLKPNPQLELKHQIEASSPYNDGWTREHHQKELAKLQNSLDKMNLEKTNGQE